MGCKRLGFQPGNIGANFKWAIVWETERRHIERVRTGFKEGTRRHVGGATVLTAEMGLGSAIVRNEARALAGC